MRSSCIGAKDNQWIVGKIKDHEKFENQLVPHSSERVLRSRGFLGQHIVWYEIIWRIWTYETPGFGDCQSGREDVCYTVEYYEGRVVFTTSIHTHPQTTLYRDFAAGVGRDPLACCFEIFEA